jgi:signal transduction histidine kinase/PAS domain-containing protein
MPLRTRFLFLLVFIFAGVSATVWFGVRPHYEKAILDERTTIVSEHQRERAEITRHTLALWAASLVELKYTLLETGDLDQTRALFSGLSSLIPEIMGMRIIEERTLEYIEFRSVSTARLPDGAAQPFRPADSALLGDTRAARRVESAGQAGLFTHWDAENRLFAVAITFRLDSEPFRMVGFFDARALENTLFVHNLGVPVRSVIWFDGANGNDAISLEPLPDYRPPSEPVSRIIETMVDGIPTLLASTPLRSLNAQYVLYMNPADIRAPIRRLFTASLMYITLAFGFIGLVSILLHRQLNRPLRRFLREIKPFASLDFTTPITRSELPDLQDVSAQMEAIREKLAHYQKINVEHVISSQQRMSKLMQHATDPIAQFDASGTFTMRNVRFTHLFQDLGLPAPEGIEAFRNLETLKRNDKSTTSENWLGSLRIRTEGYEVSIDSGDDFPAVYNVQALELFNENGVALGGQLMLYDLTKERALDRLRNDMVNIIVHELRNPISGIKGLTSVLLEQGDLIEDHERVELFELIDGSADRLSNLVDRFLQVSRLESVTMEVEKQLVHLPSLVRDISRQMEPTLLDKNLKFNLKVDNQIDPMMVSDELISDMMRNLISNAIKYGPADRTIDIELYRETPVTPLLPGYPNLVFAVTDYGYGISEEHREQIFKKFYRIKEYTREKGTGLGLAHVKEIMRKHGGSIEVDSNEQIGSRFIARMPYVPFRESSEPKLALYRE